MKKIVTTVIALAAAVVVMGQSSDVVVKRGKAVMDESYYYNLKQKADAYDKMEQQNDELQKKLAQTEQTLTQELKKNSVKMTSFNDSASYAIGKDLANNWQQQNLGINLQVVAQSLLDIVHGTNNWSRAQMTPLLRRFQAKFEENERKKREEMMASMETNKKEGTEFLKRNANDKSVKSTKSGLQYKVVKEGDGKRPTAKNRVRVHYTGKLLNGKVFDSSVERGEPMEFGVSEVIAGWTEGLQLMSEGSKYIFYIPSNLGYGDNPIGDIPPGSTLIFEVELLKIIQ
jgi:FKBP-type peptidyl-prolyl cis-trans isomerase FklB